MKTLTIILSVLAILDLGIVPVILSYVRKTGGFHYLVSTIHKLVFMVLILFIGFFLLGSVAHGLIFQLVFCATLLFVFNSTFEINNYMFKSFEPDKYNLEDMTEEGKKMMKLVFEDMHNQNKKSMIKRFKEMIHNFSVNLTQDIFVIFMVVTNNKVMKDSYLELHKIMGNDVKFSNMKNKELFFLVQNRVAIDLSVVVFSVLVFSNLA